MKTMRWIGGVFALLMIIFIGGLLNSQAGSVIVIKPPGQMITLVNYNVVFANIDLSGNATIISCLPESTNSLSFGIGYIPGPTTAVILDMRKAGNGITYGKSHSLYVNPTLRLTRAVARSGTRS